MIQGLLVLFSPIIAFVLLLILLGPTQYDEQGEVIGHTPGLIEKLWRRYEA